MWYSVLNRSIKTHQGNPQKSGRADASRPVTNGHFDIFSGAAGLYDEVIVAVLISITKTTPFTVDERVEMLREVTAAC